MKLKNSTKVIIFAFVPETISRINANDNQMDGGR